MPESAKLIDRLRTDFRDRRRKVEVLGTEVFVTPCTVSEVNAVGTMHPDDAPLARAEMLLRKCLDAAGKPVFGKEDKMALVREVAGDRLQPLVEAIYGTPAEVQAKNS